LVEAVVEPVAAHDGRVAAGLALGQRGPHAAGRRAAGAGLVGAARAAAAAGAAGAGAAGAAAAAARAAGGSGGRRGDRALLGADGDDLVDGMDDGDVVAGLGDTRLTVHLDGEAGTHAAPLGALLLDPALTDV